MSENCNKEACSACPSAGGCHSTPQKPTTLPPHPNSKVKHIIAVVSGKGGVGKSLVTSLMSIQMQRQHLKTAILDADITGPSIPKAFGITEHAKGDDKSIFPVLSKTGIKIMSMNVLLEDPAVPVVWRGPVISGAVKQFWTDVSWDDIDYMFVDMPPGTGDVPLTVFQSLPIDGILVITSPQELVSLIVEKALKMSTMLKIPVLGLIENMSYFECPDCHSRHEIFGKGQTQLYADQHGIAHVAKLPIDPTLAQLCDQGDIELYKANYLKETAEYILAKVGI